VSPQQLAISSALAPGSAPAPPSVPTRAPDPAESSIKELEACKLRMATLQDDYNRAVGKCHQEFNLTVDNLSPAQLPVLELPKPEESEVFGVLLNFLDAWALEGACNPFDWDDIAQIKCRGPPVIGVVKTLVGGLWGKFCATDEPNPKSIVPRQFALFAHHAIRRLKFTYDSQEAERAAEQGAVEVLARCKRARQE